MISKDLKKRVSILQATKGDKTLERLSDKSLLIWHEEEDINTNIFCFNHIIGLPTKEQRIISESEFQQMKQDLMMKKQTYV